MTAVLLAHIFGTFVMTGLIWFIQIVHFPLLKKIALPSREVYCKCMMGLTSWVVLPPMILELITGVLLLINQPRSFEWQMGLLLLVFLWISTFAVQMPLNRKLARGGDTKIADLLTQTNWIRTVLWSYRSFLIGKFLYVQYLLR